jgi:hypothetical protein
VHLNCYLSAQDLLKTAMKEKLRDRQFNSFIPFEIRRCNLQSLKLKCAAAIDSVGETSGRPLLSVPPFRYDNSYYCIRVVAWASVLKLKYFTKLGQLTLEFSGVMFRPGGGAAISARCYRWRYVAGLRCSLYGNPPFSDGCRQGLVTSACSDIRLNLPLKDSIKLLSVGLPGREKSNTTPFW